MTILQIADLKQHLNIVSNDDDALVGNKIAAAEAWIGQFIGTALVDFDPLPEPLKEAVRQLVAHLYENREATLIGISMADVSPGMFDLMRPYREYVF